jgi:ABC-type transport system substrate-binding protein
MRRMLYTLAFLMLLVVVTATLAGPEKNNLIIATNQEPDQFNPWEGGADTKENVMGLFYDRVYVFRQPRELAAWS